MVTNVSEFIVIYDNNLTSINRILDTLITPNQFVISLFASSFQNTINFLKLDFLFFDQNHQILMIQKLK